MIRRTMVAITWPIVLLAFLVRVIAADIFDDAWDALSGGVSSIFNQIKRLITSMFRQFINMVTTALSFVSDILTALVQFAINLTQFLFNVAMSTLQTWVGILWGLILDARNLATYLFDLVTTVLNNAVGMLWRAILAVLNTAVSLVSNLLTWVVDNVWRPLSDLIAAAWHFATVDLPNWVGSQLNNLWCFVSDIAQSIAGVAESVVSTVLDPFMTLLHAGLRALEWIVWMALHPFDWFLQLLAHFFDHGSTWLVAQIASAVEKNADTVDGWLAKFFE